MPGSKLLIPPGAAFLKVAGGRHSSPAADYFQASRAVFGQATRGQAGREFFCRLGGCSLRLRFAGDSLVPLVAPALAHLEMEPTPSADLTICLGDLTASQVTLEFPGGGPLDGETGGAMWRHEDARFFLLSQNETGSLSLLDAEENLAFYWTRDVARLPWYENSFPLRHLLAGFFRRRGQYVIHAAAVGDERGAVLIVGKGGSGKSTATLACATDGLLYLGDDYSLVAVEPQPRVWSLYSSAKANVDTLNWFPELIPHVHHPGGVKEKSSLFLNRAKGLRFAESLPIRAVLWPRITGRAETAIKPASPAALLFALAPSSLLQTPGGGDSLLRALSHLVQSVPTFVLEAGNDPARLALAIQNLLST